MITRYRKKRNIYFVLLLLCVGMMSIGFSAFSSELTISSSAIVSPDSSSFKVLFSSSGTSFLTNKVSGTVVGDATAGNASIDNNGDSPTITDLTATFTGPGQSVKYTFYAYNAGAYDAYLTGIKFNNVDGESSSKVCSAIDSSSVSTSLLTAACNDINVSVDVGTITSVMSSTSGITDHSLGKGLYEKVVVTISYSDNSNSADGDFKVKFGDIGLSYSTVAPSKYISFQITDGSTVHNLTAERGMTWSEWIGSDYNSLSIYMDWTSGVVLGKYYIAKSGSGYVQGSDVILEGESYYKTADSGEPV